MSDSVKKAFRILRLLAEHPQPLSLAAVSRGLKMNKTTAFRYLETLAGLHVVEKDKLGYRLGLALFELGNRVAVRQVLIRHADPFMRSLCTDINETVNLAQLYQSRALYLHKIESRRSLQMRADIGSELPLHCTALGKAILASMDHANARELLDGCEMKPQTRFTIVSRKKLLEEIAEVRSLGYSVDREEFEIGLTCVAVPLSMPQDDLFAAISVSASSLRMAAEDIERMGEKLKKTGLAMLQALRCE